MTYSALLYALRGAIVVGAVSTGISFGVRYAQDGECDEMGEQVGPATPLGVVVWALLGFCLWLPLLAVLFLG